MAKKPKAGEEAADTKAPEVTEATAADAPGAGGQTVAGSPDVSVAAPTEAEAGTGQQPQGQGQQPQQGQVRTAAGGVGPAQSPGRGASRPTSR